MISRSRCCIISWISNICPGRVRTWYEMRYETGRYARVVSGNCSSSYRINDVIYEPRNLVAGNSPATPGETGANICAGGCLTVPATHNENDASEPNSVFAAFGVRRRLIGRRGIPRVTSRPCFGKWSDRLFLLSSYSADRSTSGDACGRTALTTKSQRQRSDTGWEEASRFPIRLCFWYVIGWSTVLRLINTWWE